MSKRQNCAEILFQNGCQQFPFPQIAKKYLGETINEIPKKRCRAGIHPMVLPFRLPLADNIS